MHTELITSWIRENREFLNNACLHILFEVLTFPLAIFFLMGKAGKESSCFLCHSSQLRNQKQKVVEQGLWRRVNKKNSRDRHIKKFPEIRKHEKFTTNYRKYIHTIQVTKIVFQKMGYALLFLFTSNIFLSHLNKALSGDHKSITHERPVTARVEIWRCRVNIYQSDM